MIEKILVTGSAGFIGYHLCESLLEDGYIVMGIDNINDYYDVNLKRNRLKQLALKDNFTFNEIDISDKESLTKSFQAFKPNQVVNLAAQAGVRYSIKNPYAYLDSNIIGFINIIELCRHNDVKGLIVSSPANPTGAVINREEFFEISKLCKNRNIKLVSDEIYHGINYDTGNLFSALNFDKDAIVINSFSKYFSMTGWRLGWIIMPEDGIESLSKLAMNMYLSPSYVSQCAAKRVFEDYKILNSYVNQYRINRDILLNGLKKAGIDKFTFPRGAFYIYADISHLHNDSEKFCNKMLHEAGVASVPGIDFDKNRGKKFVRFSYSGKENEVLEASKRILNWLK